MGILEKVKDIENEMARTQKNKATEYHLGLLKAKLAKLRSQLMDTSKSKGPKEEGFEVTKYGDCRVALIGFPSVGKSTLLSTATHTKSEIASYEFTTLTCIPGNIEYNGAVIQLLDLPGIIEGASEGKGRGRQVISVARSADLIIIMLDASNSKNQKVLLEAELEACGIRLNVKKPDIYFVPKKNGGIFISSTCNLTRIDEKMVNMILHEYKMHNCEIVFREDCTPDELIDIIMGNVVYIPCLYVYNKIDCISMEEINELAHQPNSIVVGCNQNLNLDFLIWKIWYTLDLIRVYTKRRGEPPDFSEPLVLRNGSTIEQVCHKIHRQLSNSFVYALVWGSSCKFSPQRVGISHIVNDEDVVQIMTKK